MKFTPRINFVMLPCFLILLESGCGGGNNNANPLRQNTAVVGNEQVSCSLPTAWDSRSLTHAVVGDGTVASCTRDALASAVTNGGYITFNCGGKTTIAIAQEIPVSSGKTTIIDGEGNITLDAGGTNRIIKLESGNTLSIRNMTLKNGYSVPATDSVDPIPYSGGAISALYRSKLEIINSTFSGNQSSGGGAVYIGSDASLTVVGSTFTNNTSWYGGAILDWQSGLNVVNSTFTGNSAPQSPSGQFGWGGGIATDGSTLASLNQGGIGSGGLLSVCGSVFRNNSSANGGGVWLWAYAPDTIIVKNSTFENNTAQGLGGAGRISVGPTDYSHQGGTMTTPGILNVIGSSFLSNTANGNGGALYMDCYGDCNVVNSTFYGNTAHGVGGAIQHAGWGADVGTQAVNVRFNNVTFADNQNGNSVLFGSKFSLNNTVLVSHTAQGICSDPASNTGQHVVQYSSQGSPASCLLSGILSAADPLLGNPADHGGPTVTMLPATGSPLLQAGTDCMATDQRGQSRNTAKCTIGAVEGSQ